MTKKFLFTAILSITVIVLAGFPRVFDVSSANDCYVGADNSCAQYNYQNAPQYYTETASTAPSQPWGQIWQQGQPTRNGNQCQYTTTLVWQTGGVSQAQVTYLDPSSGTEQNFSQTANSSAQATWIVPNQSYRFSLWDTDNGQQKLLDQVYVSGDGLDCGIPDTDQYYPTANIQFSSNNAYCVGQTPTYTVWVPGATDAQATWVSQGPRGQNQLTVSLDQNGYFTGTGNAWASSDVGSWTKTVTINGQSKSLQFSVSSCGNNYGNTSYNSSGYDSNNGQNSTQTVTSFSLTSNNEFCVGQTPTYTIQANGNSDQSILWQSSGPTNNSEQTLYLNNGSFTGSGNTWTSADVGSWTKTATINGSSHSLYFTVSNCGNQNNNSTNNGGTNHISCNSNGVCTEQPYYQN